MTAYTYRGRVLFRTAVFGNGALHTRVDLKPGSAVKGYDVLAGIGDEGYVLRRSSGAAASLRFVGPVTVYTSSFIGVSNLVEINANDLTQGGPLSGALVKPYKRGFPTGVDSACYIVRDSYVDGENFDAGVIAPITLPLRGCASSRCCDPYSVYLATRVTELEQRDVVLGHTRILGSGRDVYRAYDDGGWGTPHVGTCRKRHDRDWYTYTCSSYHRGGSVRGITDNPHYVHVAKRVASPLVVVEDSPAVIKPVVFVPKTTEVYVA